MGGIEVAACKFRDNLKHLVGETADVQDVVAFLRLRRGVGLNIQTHHPRTRIAGLKPRPFRHCFAAVAAAVPPASLTVLVLGMSRPTTI